MVYIVFLGLDYGCFAETLKAFFENLDLAQYRFASKF